MNSEKSFEVKVSRGHIRDALLPMLYTTGAIPHNVEVLSLENDSELIPIRLKLKKEQEVQITRYNGKSK